MTDSLAEILMQAIPAYTPSAPAPSYSLNPGPEEESLNFTPRFSRRRLPEGTFIKTSKAATISLHRQDEKASQPIYGTQALISGQVSIHCRVAVTKVELQLLGRLEMASDISGLMKQTIKQSYVLWKGQKGDCPGEIAFGHNLPATFSDGNTQRPLPPSFRVDIDAVSAIYVKSDYRVVCIITSEKMGGLFLSQKQIRIPFKYYPRSQPPDSCTSSSLLTSLKSQPDEWSQFTSEIASKHGSGIKPLECHFLIPSVKIYGLSDIIPFHIQIRGPLLSLRELFGPENQAPQISVIIMRHITIHTARGQRRWKSESLGRGKLNAVPPSAFGSDSDTSEDHCLDWEGHIQCDESVEVGGFKCGPLTVRDYMALSVKPAIPASSKLLAHTEQPMIMLVTNSWEDQAPYHWDAWP